jgi:hypothetical protein
MARPLPLLLVVLAIVFAVLAVLYGVGAIQFLTSTGHGRHGTHAILFGILALLSLVGANFARARSGAPPS